MTRKGGRGEMNGRSKERRFDSAAREEDGGRTHQASITLVWQDELDVHCCCEEE
jgi:hypothetical protein